MHLLNCLIFVPIISKANSFAKVEPHHRTSNHFKKSTQSSQEIFDLLSDFSPQNIEKINKPIENELDPVIEKPEQDYKEDNGFPGILNDLILTIEKVSRIYDRQIARSNYSGNSTPSDLLTVILEPNTIQQVMNIPKTASGEDEILEQLTAVIIGAESRDKGYGHGLTLDPVTVIALLTLAAYLIRAVYQILIANGARSFGENSLLEFAEMAQTMVTLQNMFGNTENLIERMDVNLNNRKQFLETPATLAGAGHLWMDGNEPCLKTYFCDHLKGKTIDQFGLSELIMSIWSVLRGDFGVFKYFREEARDTNCLHDVSRCDNCVECDLKYMSQAKETQNMFRRITQVLQMFIPYFQSIFNH